MTPTQKMIAGFLIGLVLGVGITATYALHELDAQTTQHVEQLKDLAARWNQTTDVQSDALFAWQRRAEACEAAAK